MCAHWEQYIHLCMWWYCQFKNYWMGPYDTFEAYRHDLPHFTLQTVHCTDTNIYMFCMIVIRNSDCYSIQNSRSGLSKGSLVSSVRYVRYYVTYA
jgi:hypothetical protein